MNELQKRLCERYDGHYLRLNVLTSASLNVAKYEQHIPGYEASCGCIVSGLPTGTQILDIGCGVGFLLFWLQHSRPIFELTGVDISERQLALAKKHLPEAITLLREEATLFLQHNPHSFAAMFCTDVLEHAETDDELLQLLEFAKESLLPGGFIICQVPRMANLTGMHSRYIDLTHSHGFTDLSLLQLLECVASSSQLSTSLKVACSCFHLTTTETNT
ncbi:MAG: class I SAM-dependent methyltransferase [Candidatus Acidiferrales bacterium]